MIHDNDPAEIANRTLNYLKFVASFEKELPLSRAYHPSKTSRSNLSGKNPATPKPTARIKSTEKSSGLDPYPAYAPYSSLIKMQETVRGCLKCKLGADRTNFVFGVGNPEARVVFIGEGPGAEEDARGEPFVGRAGALLNKLLGEIGWRREEVYICNVVKCRPPGNRDPMPEEVAMCEPYLHEQLRLIHPEWLVALGRIAAQSLLQNKAPLKTMRGLVHHFRDFKLWVTYHPAAILRNENLHPDTFRDLQTLQRMISTGSQTPPK